MKVNPKPDTYYERTIFIQSNKQEGVRLSFVSFCHCLPCDVARSLMLQQYRSIVPFTNFTLPPYFHLSARQNESDRRLFATFVRIFGSFVKKQTVVFSLSLYETLAASCHDISSKFQDENCSPTGGPKLPDALRR